MKINELLKNFEIFMTNEERKILDNLTTPCYIDTFTEREQLVIENLARKSLLTKVYQQGTMVVVPNEEH